MTGSPFFDRDSESYGWGALGTRPAELQTWQHTCLAINMNNGELKVRLFEDIRNSLLIKNVCNTKLDISYLYYWTIKISY